MKICYVITTTNIGGAEQTLKRLILSSEIERSNLLVISLLNIGEIGRELRSEGYRVESLNMMNPIYFPISLFRLWRLIKNHHPSIVHTWLYHADFLGGIAARLAGVKHIVWSIRTTELKNGSYLTSAIRRINALLSKYIPFKIVCVAEAARIRHLSLGYCAEKMVVIPNGFDLDKLKKDNSASLKLSIEFGIEQNTIVIGSVGRFSQVKAQDIFIKAAGIVAEKYSNVRFAMIGRELNFSNDQLRKWISNTKFPERFILLGERSDINVCLGIMDIFCLASRSEGFPNALGEAMAFGLPCISTDVGDAKLLGGNLVTYIEPNDPIALANAMVQMLTLNPEKLEHLGHLSSERILHRYTMLSMKRAYHELYSAMM